MLDSLYIRNFRIFKELEIERLARVNLIVGRNNSGKSCLLEAVSLFVQNASPKVLYELIRERGQDWEIEMQDKDQPVQETENPLRHLFHGYRFPEADTNPIEIGSLKEIQNRLKVIIRTYEFIYNKDSWTFTRIDNSAIGFDNNLNSNLQFVIELEGKSKNESEPIGFLNRELSDFQKYFALKRGNGKSNVQFIPTTYMDNKKLAVLWDNINIYPQLRQEVFNALQLIDNEIQEVVLVGREKNITPILIYRNSDERIPLKSLGDGIIHLFYIILGLVNARGGVILIDEFENGLHYTAHEKVWNLVFELSEKLNVQVFATTHSYDCIRAFQEVAQKHHTEGMLFHLGRSALKSDHEKILATAYDKEELRLADLAKLEVR